MITLFNPISRLTVGQLRGRVRPRFNRTLHRPVVCMRPLRYLRASRSVTGGNSLSAIHYQSRAVLTLHITDYPKVIRAGMTEKEKCTHARKLNLARRHMTQEQWRKLIQEDLSENPKLSDRQIAVNLGVSNSTVSKTRKDMEESGELCDSHSSIGADGKERPRKPVSVFNPTPAEKKAIQNPAVLAKLSSGEVKTIDEDIKEHRHEAIKQKFENTDYISAGRIIEGDLFDKIAEIPDNSVDLLFADPPYMILDEQWDKYENVNNFMQFTESWLDIAVPKVKHTGRIYISFSQYYQFDLYNLLHKHNFYGFNFGQVIIWNYRNNNKPSDKKMYRFSYEPIFYLYGKQADVLNFPSETYGETQSNVWTIATPQSNFHEGKYHPAQKP